MWTGYLKWSMLHYCTYSQMTLKYKTRTVRWMCLSVKLSRKKKENEYDILSQDGQIRMWGRDRKVWYQNITPPCSSWGLTTLDEAKYFQQGCQTYCSQVATGIPEVLIQTVWWIPTKKNVSMCNKFSLFMDYYDFSSPAHFGSNCAICGPSTKMSLTTLIYNLWQKPEIEWRKYNKQ